MKPFGYVDILQKEFKKRLASRKKYSLRAFSRDLGLSPGYLSQVLKKKRKLSLRHAQTIIDRAGWSDRESRKFILHVQYAWAETPKGRTQIESESSNLFAKPPSNYFEIGFSQYQLIKEWYHYPIIELSAIARLDRSGVEVSRRLGISQKIAARAIESLIQVGLLEARNGVLRKIHENYGNGLAWTDEQIRIANQANKESVVTALRVLDQEPLHVRDISSVTFAMSSKKLPLAKRMIREFRRNLSSLMEQEDEKDAVYQLNLQLFRLDKE